MRRQRNHIVAALGVVLLTAASAQAGMITFQMWEEFSGAYPPESPGPWLTATFDDGGTAGSVDLTLETTNLVDAEFVFEWMFNLDPARDPTQLVFSAPTKTGAFADPVISLGVDAFRADGDGYYDIDLVFNHTGAGSLKFGEGDAVAYTLTGIPTLTASDFDFESTPVGGRCCYKSAAHVGGIGPEDEFSGWIAVPEPSALSMLVLGGLALLRRRQA